MWALTVVPIPKPPQSQRTYTVSFQQPASVFIYDLKYVKCLAWPRHDVVNSTLEYVCIPNEFCVLCTY